MPTVFVLFAVLIAIVLYGVYWLTSKSKGESGGEVHTHGPGSHPNPEPVDRVVERPVDSDRPAH